MRDERPKIVPFRRITGLKSGYSFAIRSNSISASRFDLLEAETRGPFRGPRAFDVTGAPLHSDNMSCLSPPRPER